MPEYDLHHPWVVFTLDGEEYCVNSACVESIIQPEDMTKMPNHPPHVMGVTSYLDGELPVIDGRVLLGMETLAQTVNDFGMMRQMHLDWIEALEDSVKNHKPFTKAVNPHKCKFGLWYDNYHTDNVSISFILGKIDEPHRYIHEHGAEVQKLMADNNWEAAEAKYREAEDVCRNTLLPLLDNLIETYKNVNRGMVVILQDGSRRIGLMVDEIARLVPGSKVTLRSVPPGVNTSDYIADMVLDGDHTLADVDVPALFRYVGSYALDSARC